MNIKQDGTYTKQVIYNLNIVNMYQCNLASDISLGIGGRKVKQ